MKKISIHSAGSYDKLKTESHPDLSPKANEVVVDVSHAGVNYADVCVRWGIYESAKKYVGWPITPGFETAGVVRAVGSDVRNIKVGAPVMAVSFFGGYASQVCVPENQVFKIPKGFSSAQASAFLTTAMTAYHALFQHFRLPAQSTVLIHSAAGGVGSALVQLCKIAQLKSIGVVGSTHKIVYVRELGCDHVIDKSMQDLWAAVKDFAPEGLDAVFDANGYTTLREGYRHLRPVGKLVSYGSHSILPKSDGLFKGSLNLPKAAIGLIRTPWFNPMRLMQENKSLIGFNLSFLFSRADLLGSAMEELLKWCEEGKLLPPKVTEFDFDRCGDAHALIESGKSIGKIVLKI